MNLRLYALRMLAQSAVEIAAWAQYAADVASMFYLEVCCMSSLKKRILLSLIGLFTFSSSAVAQPALLTNFPELTKSDMQEIRQARKQVASLPVGESTIWKNDETGSSGRISMIEKELFDSKECQKILYELTVVKEARPRSFQTWTCKVKDKWKMLTDKEVTQFKTKKNS